MGFWTDSVPISMKKMGLPLPLLHLSGILRWFFIPQLRRRRIALNRVRYREDGTTAHTARTTMAVFRHLFPNHIFKISYKICYHINKFILAKLTILSFFRNPSIPVPRPVCNIPICIYLSSTSIFIQTSFIYSNL